MGRQTLTSPRGGVQFKSDQMGLNYMWVGGTCKIFQPGLTRGHVGEHERSWEVRGAEMYGRAWSVEEKELR